MEQETLKNVETRAMNIADVLIRALPCPFCGERPDVDKSYIPSIVEITCNGENCAVRPCVYESVQFVENKGETGTYSPMYELHWESVLAKWNTRNG